MRALDRISGVILVAISAAGFSTLAIFGRYAYAGGVGTLTLLFLRFTIAAALMAGLLLLRRERLPRGGALARLVGMGGLGYVAQSFCFLSAIKYASAGLVALLLYLYPAIVAVLAAIFLGKKLTLPKIIALSMATLGAFLTANPQGGQWLGVALALAAAVIYAIYIIVGAGVMQQVSAVQSSTVIFASAGAVFGILTLIGGAQWPTTSAGWLPIGGMILFATMIPAASFLGGIKRIGPTDASMLSTLEPVFTIILAWWLYGETLQPAALLGGGLILAAALLLTYTELAQRG